MKERLGIGDQRKREREEILVVRGLLRDIQTLEVMFLVREILGLEREILEVTGLQGEGDAFQFMGLDRERLGVMCLKRERE